MPVGVKKLFSKFEISKSSQGRNSQYFLTEPVLNERYQNFAHTYRADFADFALGGLWGPKYQKSLTWVTFGTPQAPLGQTRQNRLCTYVQNFDIFN